MVYTCILKVGGWKAEDFLFYCCPDCNQRTKEKTDFLAHALIHISEKFEPENHEVSRVDPFQDCRDIKPSNDFQNSDQHPEDPLDMQNSKISSLSECSENDVSINRKRIRKTPLKTGLKKLKKAKEKVPNKKAEQFKIKCWECSEEIYPKSRMILHMRTVHGHDDIYKCAHCDTRFKDKMKLDIHKFRVHGEGHIQTYTCAECPYTTLKSCNLIQHVRQVHSNARYSCDMCDERFKSTKDLRDHYIDDHERESFDCDRCDARFISKTGLEGHVSVVHEKKYAYKCDKCDKAYANNIGLRRHIIRVHTGLKSHACDQCNLKFVFPSDLRGHVKDKHDRIGRREELDDLPKDPLSII